MNNRKTIPIIHIIGLPGAGKTTLAKRLSKVLKIPILCIGRHRLRFPKTPIGEVDAWLALFRELSRHRWKNCILESTGLNCREGFLRLALPFENMFTVKLEASRNTLFRRIGKKSRKEQGGEWLYSGAYRDKYEFVRKLFKNFGKVHADCYIDANQLSEIDVFRKVFKKIDSIKGMIPDE